MRASFLRNMKPERTRENYRGKHLVYVSIYKIYQLYIYWKMMSIRNIIQQHNSGIVYVSTEPLNIWPYAIFVYICGFDKKLFMILNWKTIKINKRYINKKQCQWYKNLESMWIITNHGSRQRKLWRQTKRFDFSFYFQWLIYTDGVSNQHCITYYYIYSYHFYNTLF